MRLIWAKSGQIASLLFKTKPTPTLLSLSVSGAYPEHFADACRFREPDTLMINSCIVNHYTGLAPSSGAWRELADIACRWQCRGAG